ncbi:hypothetical protein CRM73_00235 [Kocuria sp. CCUG 69068]|uniref:hypothetical protein n=1 Tax=Kocuria sp. CCUG 69068 TaxID=2043138 RepID=UPI001E49C526|nr:hypothetical protein [Kocuria sp. CCUG 69068]
MTARVHQDPPTYSNGQPLRSAVELRPYGCTCRVVHKSGMHEGKRYDRVTYIEPDCPFRDRHLGQVKS